MTEYTVVAKSSNYGLTFSSGVQVGSTPGLIGGFDVIRVGDVTLAGADAQGYKATTIGGTYTSLGADGATSGSQPILLQLLWKRIGTTSSSNFNTSTPDYLLGEADGTLWLVAGSGGRTNITPTGSTGIANTNCSTTWLGTIAAVLVSVSGTIHLFTSTTIGSSNTWVDRGALTSSAAYLRFRKLGGYGKELYIANNTAIVYSSNSGATLITKTTPATTAITVVEAWG